MVELLREIERERLGRVEKGQNNEWQGALN